MATPRSSSLAKGLTLLRALMEDGGRSSLSAIAAEHGMPLATAHRLTLTLEGEGFVERHRRGYFHPGPALQALGIGAMQPTEQLARRLRHRMARLARTYGAFLHFGILEEGMVTYVVKEGGAGQRLFTEESMQLEAYCSAIGKILLAALPGEELERYLASAPFIALTAQTLTDPDSIRREVDAVRAEGVAFDRFEIRDDLFCLAVPVRDAKGNVAGGLSASFLGNLPDSRKLGQVRRSLRIAAEAAARDDRAG